MLSATKFELLNLTNSLLFSTLVKIVLEELYRVIPLTLLVNTLVPDTLTDKFELLKLMMILEVVSPICVA